MLEADLCGDKHSKKFVSAKNHPFDGHDAEEALKSKKARCYPGGSDIVNDGFVANDGKGQWLRWNGPVSPDLAGRPDANYLHPISRRLNPNFKGVIFVDGKVAVSGTLRGRVTLASTKGIVLIDDILYATDPAAGTCVDLLGMFSGKDIVVTDNAINAPQRVDGKYRTYDDSKDEFFHGVILALDNFTVENYNSGSRSAEKCGTRSVGRGCLYLTGGIIQRTRGPVGRTDGTGYLKRYSYDQCGQTSPPPYYPTTGYFAKGQQFMVDPAEFNIDKFWSRLIPQR